MPNGDPADAAAYQGSGTFEESVHELFKVVPEVTIVHLAYTLIAVFITFFGLFSGFVKERLYIGEAIIATLFGIAFSGYAAGIFAPRTWSQGHHFDEITLEVTRVVIALSVFAVGVELPKAYVLRHWRSLSILLGPIMLAGWMISGALMYAIIPGLEFLPALVVAAGVTPTDPILASSVVGKGKFAQEHVPAHIRHILQAESGSNDGAAFPFLYLAMFLLLRDHHSIGTTIGYWLLLVVLYQIILGIFIGAVVGILARKLLKFSKRRELIDRESMVAMYVALALLVTGLTTLAGSDDLLAAFACGTAFAWDDWFTESIEESNFSSTIDLLANCTMFIYLGATMPFSAWNDASLTLTPWRLVVLAISILALRRLPTIFLMQWWIPDIKTRREAVFAGHFGPIGVGAIFISTLAASKLPTPTVPPETSLDILALSVQPITYFLVLSSILIHGLTISFFSLGRRVHSRVTSMTRTFTAASGDGEPSWMSRVKRARVGEDIIINRDDDPADLAEKGAIDSENMDDSGDLGKLAMFGAPSSSGGTVVGSSGSSVKEETPEELENDEDPPKNILVDDRHQHVHIADGLHQGRRVDHSPSRMDDLNEDEEEFDEKTVETEPKKKISEPASEASAKERRYCKPGETKTWVEGKKIIIDHGDGTEPEVVVVNPTKAAKKEADAHPQKTVASVPTEAVEAERQRAKNESYETPEQREESAVKKAAYKMLRRGSVAAATEAATRALIKPFSDDGLTPTQREEKQRKKLERDAWCRQEKHYKESGSQQEWLEGSKVVTERTNRTGDEKITVREMTDEEKAARAAKHLAALKALGLGLESVEGVLQKNSSKSPKPQQEAPRRDYFGPNAQSPPSPGKGKGKIELAESPGAIEEHVPTPSPQLEDSSTPVPTKRPNPGLALTRTDRVDTDDEDEASDDDLSPSRRAARKPSPPPAKRGNSMSVMRQLFKRQGSVSADSVSRGRNVNPAGTSRGSSPERSIRFAAANRPARESFPGAGSRPLPVVGGSISARKTTGASK